MSNETEDDFTFTTLVQGLLFLFALQHFTVKYFGITIIVITSLIGVLITCSYVYCRFFENRISVPTCNLSKESFISGKTSKPEAEEEVSYSEEEITEKRRKFAADEREKCKGRIARRLVVWFDKGFNPDYDVRVGVQYEPENADLVPLIRNIVCQHRFDTDLIDRLIAKLD